MFFVTHFIFHVLLKVEGKKCDFFEWIDLEICSRSAEVILGLLRRIRTMEEDVETGAYELKKSEEKTEILARRIKQLSHEKASIKCWCRIMLISCILS